MTYEQLVEQIPQLLPYTQNMPDRIKRSFTLRTYPAHTVIHHKDSVLTRFGIVCKGEHRVINEFENGNIFMVEKNRAISFVGEVTLLAGEKTSSVTIETLTECLVMTITLEDFEYWLEQDPGFLRLLCQSISKKLYHSTYNKGERQFYSASYLVMKYLARVAAESKQAGKGKVVIKRTRQQMSEELGMTVKTLNRTVSRLRDEGRLCIEKGKVALTPEQFLGEDG